MKKMVFVVAIAAAMVLSGGKAWADSGFWFGAHTGSNTTWGTYINVHNNTGADQAVTVTFYQLDGTLIGSTTQTLAANGGWNFSTAAVSDAIPASSFEPSTSGATRGTVVITPGSASNVYGYATIFNSSSNSGFNFSNSY